MPFPACPNWSRCKTGMQQLLPLTEFDAGARYADYDSSTDKVAAYGVAALIGGGLAAKAGLFAKLGPGPGQVLETGPDRNRRPGRADQEGCQRQAPGKNRRIAAGPTALTDALPFQLVEEGQGLRTVVSAHLQRRPQRRAEGGPFRLAEQLAAQVLIQLHAGHPGRLSLRHAGNRRGDRRRDATGAAMLRQGNGGCGRITGQSNRAGQAGDSRLKSTADGKEEQDRACRASRILGQDAAIRGMRRQASMTPTRAAMVA